MMIPKRPRRFIRARYEAVFLRRGMSRLLALNDPSDPPPRVLRDLVGGWGNASMSAWVDFIRAFLRCARETEGPILECGSGLSTVLLGLVAARTGKRVYSLEHHAIWADRARRVLRTYGIASVEILVSDLRSYGAYSWYDPPLDILPKNFSLVVCDGPPWDTPGGRYGLLPVMRSHLKPGCIILLDDAHRAGERAIAERWARELGTSFAIEGSDKMFARLSVPKSS
ncbi:MAG TPA: class I SAM-dependent methyltransferase [Candidatus Krumholzibacteriaceae bacterium]